MIAGRTATNTENASATTIAGALPSGLTNGDVVVVSFSCVDVPASFTGPPGWAALFSPLALGSARTFAAYYKVITSAAGETAPSASWAVAGRATAQVEAYSGVHQTTPLDAPPVTGLTGLGTTLAVGSVTTTAAGARLVGGCAIASASASTITKPTEMTQLAVTTGTGVRSMLTDEDRATAGATGTRTWTSSTSLAMGAYSVALRPAGAATPTPVLVTGWIGAPTPGGFTVSTHTTDATAVRLKIGTDVALTAGVVFTDLVAPDVAGWVMCEAAGLDPATPYYYAVEMTDGVGATHLSEALGPARTLPTPGTPASFRIASGSCLLSGNATSTAFDNLLAADPDLFFHLGDFHYGNSTSTSQAAHRGQMETQLAANAGLRAVLARVPTVYVKSDHDAGGGNGALPGSYTAPNRAAHLQIVPHLPQVDPLALYHSFVVGRVRLIVTDDRYLRTTTEYLDADQVDWLKTELVAAEPVKIWMQNGPWLIGDAPGDPAAGADKWNDYPDQHAELGAWIEANAVGQLLTVHGDSHSLELDDGSNNAWGGFPVFCTSPFFQNAMVRGGPYSEGTWPVLEPDVGGATASQYGLLDFTDDGDQITVALSGRDGGDVERVALIVNVATPPPGGPGVLTVKGATVVQTWTRGAGEPAAIAGRLVKAGP